jgi:hypothetical protein
MGHTPGPWTLHGWADNDYEINAALDTVCNVPGFDDDTVDADRAEANARLIAAAPELLAALREIADECNRRLRKGEDSGDRLTLQLCKAAIAKAEGRSE